MLEKIKLKSNFKISTKDLTREIYREKLLRNSFALSALTFFVLTGLCLIGYFISPLLAFWVLLIVLGKVHIIDRTLFNHYHHTVINYKNDLDGNKSKTIEKITYKNIKALMGN